MLEGRINFGGGSSKECIYMAKHQSGYKANDLNRTQNGVNINHSTHEKVICNTEELCFLLITFCVSASCCQEYVSE